jgi:hypothetical protein
VTVGSHTENELVFGETGSGPLVDEGDGGTLLVITGSAGVVQRSVGSERGRPVSPDIVVHDFDIIENIGESGDIGRGVTGGILEGTDYCSGERKVFRSGFFAKLLESGEEVGGVLRVDDVAANTLSTGIFPTRNAGQKGNENGNWRHSLEVKSTKLIFGGQAQDGLDSSSAIFSGEGIRKKLRAAPSSECESGLDLLGGYEHMASTGKPRVGRTPTFCLAVLTKSASNC